MAGYKRFVSYIYQYDENRKGANCGFVKAESRNGRFRTALNLRGIFLGSEEECRIYALVRRKEYVLGLPIGQAKPENGNLEFKWNVGSEQLCDTAYCFDDLCGVCVDTGRKRCYTAVWDDKPYIPSRFILEDIKDEVKAAEVPAAEEKEENTVRTMPDEEIRTAEESNAQKSAEEIQAAESDTEKFVTDASSSEALVQEPTVELNEDIREPAIDIIAVRDAAEVSEMSVVEASEAEAYKQGGDITEGTEPETAETPTEPEQQPDAEERKWNLSGEERERLEQCLQEAKDIYHGVRKMTTVAEDWSALEEERFEFKIEAEQYMENSGLQSDCISDEEQPEGMDEGNHDTNGEFDVAVPAEKEEVQEEKHEELGEQPLERVHEEQPDEDTGDFQTDDKWERLKKKYKNIQPFQDDEIAECIQIEPKDLMNLQKDEWILGNNSFLLHGYYNYRYLILGKVRSDGEPAFILGVPGIFENQEKMMANMFGFPNFKAAKRVQVRNGEFGYWYRTVK